MKFTHFDIISGDFRTRSLLFVEYKCTDGLIVALKTLKIRDLLRTMMLFRMAYYVPTRMNSVRFYF